MKKHILLLFLALIIATPAFSMTADELAAKLQQSYDNTRDLKAEFTQDSLVKAMNISRQGSGTLTIKKPGMLRYTYARPDRQEIIVRGEELTMYMPDAKQAVKKKLDRAVLDRTPATFLAGLGRITDSFKVGLPKGAGRDKAGNYLLELTPRGNGMGVKKITLSVEPGSFGITGFTFVEESGNTNSFKLRGIRINEGVDDNVFEVRLPSDVKVMKE